MIRFRLDLESGLPPYLQLIRQVRHGLRLGLLREGERVTIYCYTTGEPVHENVFWVKIKLAPNRYIPAAYLRAHAKPPSGDPGC